MIHLVRLLTLALLVPVVASAQTSPDPAPETPTPPEDAAAETTPAAADTETEAKLAESVKDARAAAEAAREAAEAARQAAEAAQKAAESHAAAPAAPAEEKPAEKAEEKPAEKKGPPPWSFQLGATVVSVTGNANAVTTRVSGLATGSWEKWAVEAKAGLAYGQTRPQDETLEPEVTALNGEGRLRGDRKLGKGVSAYLLGGLGFDHVASIELQVFGEPGLSMTWWETTEGDFVKSKLRTDLGFRATQENRFQYYPAEMNLDDVTIFAPRIASDLRYALSKQAVFTWAVEVLPDVVNTKNVRANSTATISAQLVDGLAMQLSFTVRHVGDPAEGKVPTDTELAAGITATF